MIAPRKGKPWPWNTIPEPRPADWGIGMTVCIVSYSMDAKAFVGACDRMLSVGQVTSQDDATAKFLGLGQNWLSLFSANNISSVTPILASVRRTLTPIECKETLDDAINAFKVAFQNEKKKNIEARILPHGMSLEEFYQSGLEKLGTDIFSRVFTQIESFDLEVEFLVFGFSEGTPHIFTFSDPGIEKHFDIAGCWAIGSGANAAIASIFGLKGAPIRFRQLHEVIYRVCEAKFYSESAHGVGKETNALYFAGGKDRYVFSDIASLRQLWESTSNRPLPDGTKLLVDAMVETAKNRTRVSMPQLPSPQPTENS
jgi:hypothetical protein